MDDRTEENLGNNGARTYLDVMLAKLVGTIQDIVTDPERLEPDEDGESLLMPSVDILATLCERYNAAPPRLNTVKQWHEKYLAAYDAGIDAIKPTARFKSARRKVIENTFRWLENLAEGYHDS